MLRAGGIPLYYQLETILRRKIDSGELTRGAVIPSEETLAQEYQVSRVTIRQALSLLVQDGLLIRHRGKGTFVSKTCRVLPASKLSGSLEDLISMGVLTQAKPINVSMRAPGEDARQALELGPEEQVLHIERLRLTDDTPLSYVNNYFPAAIGEKLMKLDLDAKPLLVILEDDLGIEVGEALQTVEATVAEVDVAKLLETRVGDPLLKVKRTVYDVQHRPVEYVSVLYRADKYSFSVRLKRKRTTHPAGWEGSATPDAPLPLRQGEQERR